MAQTTIVIGDTFGEAWGKQNVMNTELYEAVETTIIAAIEASNPASSLKQFPHDTVLTGYLECDGSDISMTTYFNLFAKIGDLYGLNTGATFTTTFATNTINLAAHTFSDDDVLRLTTSGADLPDPLVIGTNYYIIESTVGAFKLSLTEGGAAIDLTDDGTGTHTAHNEFKIPDYRGEFLRNWDHGAGTDPDAASRTDAGDGTTGDNVGTKQADEYKSHPGHATGTRLVDDGTNSNVLQNSESTGGNETRPINTNVMVCIKF